MPPNRRLPAVRSHRVERLSAGRLQVIRLLITVAGRHTVHGLVEVDVTATLQRPRAPGSGTVTALVVAAVAAAVREHPQVNSRRAGRKLVVFDDVDVIVTVERTSTGGATAPVPLVVQRADSKSEAEIAAELRAGKDKRGPSGDGPHALVSRLPFWLVRAGVSVAGNAPRISAALGPPIGVSSLGMFASGWAIPISPLTVMVTVGGIAHRPALVDGRLVERDILPLTLSFDHTVVDGAPAARFAASLVSILQGADRSVGGPDR